MNLTELQKNYYNHNEGVREKEPTKVTLESGVFD